MRAAYGRAREGEQLLPALVADVVRMVVRMVVRVTTGQRRRWGI
jgi:hypothetical protein